MPRLVLRTTSVFLVICLVLDLGVTPIAYTSVPMDRVYVASSIVRCGDQALAGRLVYAHQAIVGRFSTTQYKATFHHINTALATTTVRGITFIGATIGVGFSLGWRCAIAMLTFGFMAAIIAGGELKNSSPFPNYWLEKNRAYSASELASRGYSMNLLTGDIKATPAHSSELPCDTYELIEDIQDSNVDEFSISLFSEELKPYYTPLRVLLLKGIYAKTEKQHSIFKMLVLDATAPHPIIIGYSSLALSKDSHGGYFIGHRSDVIPGSGYEKQAIIQRARSLLLLRGSIHEWRSSEWRTPPAEAFYSRFMRDPRFLVKWFSNDDNGTYVTRVSEAPPLVAKAKMLLLRELGIGPKDHVVTLCPGGQLPSSGNPEDGLSVPWEWFLASSGAHLEVFEPSESVDAWKIAMENDFGRGNKRIIMHRDLSEAKSEKLANAATLVVVRQNLFNSMVNVHSKQEVVNAIKHMLKPGGYIIIESPGRDQEAELPYFLEDLSMPRFRLLPIENSHMSGPIDISHNSWLLYRLQRTQFQIPEGALEEQVESKPVGSVNLMSAEYVSTTHYVPRRLMAERLLEQFPSAVVVKSVVRQLFRTTVCDRPPFWDDFSSIDLAIAGAISQQLREWLSWASSQLQNLGNPLHDSSDAFIDNIRRSSILTEHYSGDLQEFFSDLTNPRSPARRMVAAQINGSGTEKTSLFRHWWQFQYLEEAFRSVYERSLQENVPLNILSLGSSNGAEAVSIATTLLAVADQYANWWNGSKSLLVRTHIRGYELHPERIIAANSLLKGINLYSDVGEEVESQMELENDASLRFLPSAIRAHLIDMQGLPYYKGSAISLVNAWLPRIRDLELISYEEASVLDANVLKAISTASILFFNNLNYLLNSEGRSRLVNAFHSLPAGSYVFLNDFAGGIGAEHILADPSHPLGVGSLFEVIYANRSGMVLRKLPKSTHHENAEKASKTAA